MTGNNSEVFSVLAIAISTLALAVSAATAWLTLLRRGTVKMTQPTVIFFGPDGPRSSSLPEPQKIFLRALLFSTSKRGRIIENMYVSLSDARATQDFNVWAYGEKNELVRGSGLFFGETGVEANHHFLVPKERASFRFVAGQQQLDVYAHLLGDAKRTLLFSQTLEISYEATDAMSAAGAGLYFDWAPDKRQYVSHVDDPLSIWKKLGRA
jgi:hypothetical protein